MKLDLKKNWVIFFYTFSIIILFISPVLFFGIEDVENYQITLFSSSIIGENYLNPFIFFTDSYGPGIEFPMGSGLSSHPLILFIKNKKIFYFLFWSFHLLLSCFYFFKISKLYKINLNIFIAVPLLIFSNINFNHIYANDWVTGVFIYNFIFVLFYQFLKILKKNSLKDFIKFSIFFYFYFDNSHPGLTFMILIFFLIIFLFSKKKLEILKSYKPYLFFTILVLLLSEKIYFISSVYFNLASAGGEKTGIQPNYSFSDFINSLWPFYGYYRVYDRLPPNPYLLIFSLIFVIKFFNDKRHLDLKIAYLLTLLFVFSPILISITIFPGLWWFRYFVYIAACLIFLSYLNSLSKKKKFMCVSILFLYIVCVYAVNVRGVSKVPNNYIKNKVEDYKLINFLNDLKLSNNFNRIYFGPEAFDLIHRGNKSRKYGIYNQTDLINYNLIPFNGYFKNVSSTKFFSLKPIDIMYTKIFPNLEHLSNPLFLSIFNIKYSFVSSNDLKYLTKKNYKTIKKIFIENQQFYIVQNNIDFLTVNNVEELNKKISQCKKIKIDCVLDNYKHFDLIDIKFEKIKNGYYKFLNTDQNTKVNLVLPFVYSNNNWKCNNKKCDNIGNFLIFYKNFEENLSLKYDDKTRYYLKILSLLNLVILLVFLFYLDFFKSYLANKKK
tara:strand:+ start:2943 stop:4931 length:1989 start_codon:yes stop_codon:yes gene_type:complete